MQKFCMWLAGVAVLSMCSAAAQETPKNVLMLDTGGHMAIIRDIAFTPDGRQLVSASEDKTIRVWDLETGKTVRTIRGEIAPGDPGKIYAMALSPNGKWLAAGGLLATFDGSNYIEVGTIRLYDFASGRLVALLKGHTAVVLGLAFSPDGRYLISGSGLGDFTAIIWYIETRQLKHRLRGHSAHIYAVGFTPDGQRAVTGSDDNDLRLWRVKDGGEIAHMTGHGDKASSLAVAPDGTIASGDNSGEIRLWDGKTGALLKMLAQQGTDVGSLSFSPDGNTLLSSCGYGGCSAKPEVVYDVASGRKIATYRGHDNIVLATAISPDGRWAATGGGNGFLIHIWDLRTGERRSDLDSQPLTLGGQGQPVWAVGFSTDGRRIGWGNTWQQSSPVDRGPLQYALTLPSAEDVLPRPFSFTEAIPPHPDADASALSREGRGQEEKDTVIQPSPLAGEGGEGRSPLPGEGEQAASEGRRAIGPEDFLRAAATHGDWSLEHRKGGAYGYDAILDIKRDGKVVQSIERGSTDGYGHSAYSFPPDGETIISGGLGGTLTAYDRAGNGLGDFIGHEGDVWAVAPSPDGRFLVSGAADQTVRLWNLKNHELLVTLFHRADGEWVMWTPEGFFVSSENGGRLVGWQINQGPDKEARYVTADQVRKLFFRPDLVAAKIAGENDKIREETERLDIDAILNSGPAPEVAIVTPGDGWVATDNKASITVRVTDQGGGIGRIEFRVNGQRKGAAFGALALNDRGEITREFELGRIENTIEVIASNRPNFVESQPASVTVKVDDQTLKGVPDLYVLAVGVDNYQDSALQLKYAVNDARALSQTLRDAAISAAGVDFYRNVHVETLFDEQVTRAAIAEAFERIGKMTRATDVFLFFIAGHGKSENGVYYFLPPDFRNVGLDPIKQQGFNSDDWDDWAALITADKTLLIYDTCESGALVGAQRGASRGIDHIAAYERLRQRTGRMILSASSKQDIALEGYRNKHGILTYAILEAIVLADQDGDDQIVWRELTDYIGDRVPQISCELTTPVPGNSGQCYRQQPQASYTGSTGTLPVMPRYAAAHPDLLTADETVTATAGDAIGRKVPTAPTHLVIKNAALFEAVGGNVIKELPQYYTVRAVETKDGFVLIAREGKTIGYIEADKLANLQ